MKLSNFYLPLLKDIAEKNTLISHKLTIRSSLVRSVSNGLYSWLPYGRLVLNKIIDIVNKEMQNIGGQEVIMPLIQPIDLWEISGRVHDYGQEMLKIKDRKDSMLFFAPTHEEIFTFVTKNDLKSYKQLPLSLYQINWKFRDEIRPRFGIMRSREFLMKDGYSFDIDHDSAQNTYYTMMQAYFNIFKNMGLDVIIARSRCGPIGGYMSHEFLIKVPENTLVGDKVYHEKRLSGLIENLDGSLDNVKKVSDCYSAIEEIYTDELNTSPPCELSYGIEVGHIFYFGDKYTKSFNSCIKDSTGKNIHPYMGSYGIGISRLVAAIIEANHDDKGIVWPYNVAPFKIIFIILHQEVHHLMNEIYAQLLPSIQQEILIDDTNDSNGVKFSRADLIGIPIQCIIGKRSRESEMLEIKLRASEHRYEISIAMLINKINSHGISILTNIER